MRLLPFVLVSLMFSLLNINGQTKYEKEYRLSLEEVPIEATQFIQSLNLDSKVKWYKEEAIGGITIEAKSKYLNQNISIEFDLQGIIEDIEIEIDKDDIPKDTQQNILSYLESNYKKFKIKKIQKQYLGNKNALKSLITGQNTLEKLVINYEIVFKGITDESHNLFEILFSEEGTMLQKSEIIFRNTDNLQF